MLDPEILVTTDDPKSSWHSWILNAPKHTSKQDRPEREVIAFATGFALFNEPGKEDTMGLILPWILRCTMPILICLSMLANITIIRVSYVISQWKFPSCIYVTVLSLIDLLGNTSRLLDHWCQISFSMRFFNSLSLTSDAVCSSLTISVYFLYHLSSMIRSALAMELYYTFKCPLAHNRKTIVCRMEHLILLFISVLLIFNSHFLWTYSLVNMNHKQSLVPAGNYCTYLVKWVSPTFRDFVWPMLDTLIGEICPIVAVSISSVLIGIRVPGTICGLTNKDKLERYMIDVKAFIDTRQFIFVYNVVSLLVLLLPSLVFVTYKGLVYQKNHAAKVVTTFSTARSYSRAYVTPGDIYTVNLLQHILILVFPILVMIIGGRFSVNGFKKEMWSLFNNTRKSHKISFII